ncbi:MAG: hypothetical protein ACLUFV_10945 [Acutalibacteraceae bacterium]
MAFVLLFGGTLWIWLPLERRKTLQNGTAFFPQALAADWVGSLSGLWRWTPKSGARPQAKRQRERAVTVRRGFPGLLPLFSGAADGSVRPPLKRRRSCVGMALYILCHICIKFFMFFLVPLLCKRSLSAVAYINKKCRKSSV